MRQIIVLFCALGLMGASPTLAQQPDMDHITFQVGEVYYFGYGGIDLPTVRAQMPLHASDSFNFATFDGNPIEAAITRATGKPPTDIGEVCCNEAKQVTFYIGLAGTSSRPLPTRAAPATMDHLAPEAIALYDAAIEVLGAAVAAGRGGEDDSLGYALPNDPASHAINLKMRAYAVKREQEITRVLENAADAKQRQVAAALLGYVQRSPTQVKALERAILDPDGDTRNNAVRALAVLASAQNAPVLKINPAPLIALLYSGKWTDRNKASFLLNRLLTTDDPALSEALKQQALPALVEGASWDEPHAAAYVFILSHVLRVTPEKVKQMIASGSCCNNRQ